MLFIGVHLSYYSHQNFDRFVYYLAKLRTTIEEYDSPSVCALGDFNADIGKRTDLGKDLNHFA